MLNPVQISCVTSHWHGQVVQSLTDVLEIDLIHFLFADDVEFCQTIAAKYSVDFTSTPQERVAFFRKRLPAKRPPSD